MGNEIKYGQEDLDILLNAKAKAVIDDIPEIKIYGRNISAFLLPDQIEVLQRKLKEKHTH